MRMHGNKLVLLTGMILLVCATAVFGEAGGGRAWSGISQAAILSIRNDEGVRWIAEKTFAIGSASNRVAFLGTVIATAAAKGTAGSNEKSAALWLLGDCGGREGVPLLLANLEWKDEMRQDMPALVSLVVIGEDAVEGLLGVVLGANETDIRKELAMDALEGIKGAQFEEFVRDQKDRRGEDVGLELFMNAVD